MSKNTHYHLKRNLVYGVYYDINYQHRCSQHLWKFPDVSGAGPAYINHTNCLKDVVPITCVNIQAGRRSIQLLSK